MSDENNNNTTPPSKPIGDGTPAIVTQNKRKRKREKEKANKQLAETTTTKTVELVDANENEGQFRPSKRLEPKKPAKPEKFNVSIAHMDPNLIADYIGQRLRKFEKDLSAVELDDRFIPARAFLDTTSYGSRRTLENLAEYLKMSLEVLGLDKGLHETSKALGAPHTLIITAAALRAADLARAVKAFQTKECIVAKLFAKHIKLKESIELCNNSRIAIGVGTPGRVLALIREGALNLDNVAAIVLDMSAINEKQQGIFDIRETQKDLLDLLNEPTIKSNLGEQIRLLAY